MTADMELYSQSMFQGFYQSAAADQFHDVRRDFSTQIPFPRGQVLNLPSLSVNGAHIKFGNSVCFRAFNCQNAQVNTVAVKNSCIGLGHDGADAKNLKRKRRGLPAGAGTQIIFRHKEVAWLYGKRKLRVHRTHGIFVRLLLIQLHIGGR